MKKQKSRKRQRALAERGENDAIIKQDVRKVGESIGKNKSRGRLDTARES